ncbi:MAG: ATP-dependent protease ATPase subunit HslU [Firmicutes bacterium]|nr:ATP-dependent protease ATPase subunit HslU [Bacillota bacterium]
MDLTPLKIVEELDRYIVGQSAAKRAVAIALRNRFRRASLPPELRDEVMPKNILMIGPTGVGKTEIARRLAKLAKAPFIKVEATKFTEVGYVGRDVESIVRDLTEVSVRLVKAEKMKNVEDKAVEAVNERLLDSLAPIPKQEKSMVNPFGAFFGAQRSSTQNEYDPEWNERVEKAKNKRAEIRRLLEQGELEEYVVEVEVEDQSNPMFDVLSTSGLEEMGINFNDILGGIMPKRKHRRKLTVSEARKILLQEEASRLLDMDAVASEAIEWAEQAGIVFIDEIDKIAGREGGAGPDVSRGGVQRDILPIVEGATVMTKYGPVRTDHILFIAAGAFHTVKPSDLIPELQGRFPIRVELDSLKKADFKRILTEPKNALIKQYIALLEIEGVKLSFTEDGIDKIAEIAEQVNQESENIGARRLHTILERILEEISFNATEIGSSSESTVTIDSAYVEQRLRPITSNRDLSKYIL